MSLIAYFFSFSLSTCENITISNINYCLSPDLTASVTGMKENVIIIDLRLPEFVEHNEKQYKVTSISEKSFAQQPISGELFLPNNLLSIYNKAFMETGITNITFGNGLVHIGNHSFYNCVNLSCPITIPEKVSTLGFRAFEFTSITSLQLNEELTVIEKEAFCGCACLACDLIIPDCVTSIGYAAFMQTQILSLQLGKGLTIIGPDAFNECYNLTGTLIIPDGVTTIDSGAFQLTSIESLKLGKNLTTIGPDAFNECYNLTGALIIPDEVTFIGEAAFKKTKITSLQLGKKLTTIGNFAFVGCYSLNCELVLPLSVKYIGESAFREDPIFGVIDGSHLQELSTAVFCFTKITGFVFPVTVEVIPKEFFAFSLLTGVVSIPHTVTRIDDGAFRCTKITTINLQSNLKYIGDFAFERCDDLKCSSNFYEMEYIGLQAFTGTNIKSGKIDCKNISQNAFLCCNAFTGSLAVFCDYIGKSAFGMCLNIEHFQLNTKHDIPDSLLWGCKSLVSFLFFFNEPFQYSIGEYAFELCTSLYSITIPNTLIEIKENAFFMCSSLSTNFDFSNYPNLTEIKERAFFGCTSLFGELTLPNKITSISAHVFSGCKISGSLSIPDSVKSIGMYAFYKCTELSGSIIIGDGVERIEDSAFSQCQNVAGNIIFGRNLSYIGKFSFFGCSSIKGNLIFRGKVTTIQDSAFYGCCSLRGQLILPPTLEYIGANAFAECNGFTDSLVIPSSVKSIGKNAFFSCQGFKDVIFESNQVEVGEFAFANMHNKCFSNVPQSFENNDPVVYSSDNFNGNMLPKSSLNMNCDAFYAIDKFLVTITVIFSSGVAAAGFAFLVDWWRGRKTNISKYTLVFNEIISQCIENGDQNGDYGEITHNIINRINERLNSEENLEKFTMTKGEAKKALESAIEESWPTIRIKNEEQITKLAFDGIKFRKFGFRCKKMCKSFNCRKSNSDEEELPDLGESNQYLCSREINLSMQNLIVNTPPLK